MMARQCVVLVVAANLLVHALSLPFEINRLRRGSEDNELDRGDSGDEVFNPALTLPPASADTFEDRMRDQRTTPSSMVPLDEDDDDDDFADFGTQPSPVGGGGGSNIFSLLNLASSLFPGSSSGQDDSTGVRNTQNGGASSPLWDFKLDIFKALVRLITGVIGSTFASSSSSNSISG